MQLNELLKGVDVAAVYGSPDVDVTGISHDSRHIQPGDVFLAIPGFKVDASSFIPKAIASGAVAVVSRSPIKGLAVPQVIVSSPRAALAKISCNYYGNPSEKLKIIGITGTNGKTTICYLLEHILSAMGHKVGLIGTVETKIAGEAEDSSMTTPESIDLQRLLDKMVKKGVTHVVMEVSSHSLALDRVLGIEFDAAVFTNLTHDHLDFHDTMQEYMRTKLRLFQRLGIGSKKDAIAVINADDLSHRQFLAASRGRALTYGINSKADLMAKNINFDIRSMEMDVFKDEDSIHASSKIIGMPNAYNILASILSAMVFGGEVREVLNTIAGFTGAPGRYEIMECARSFPVIVDFAHSPDSLQKLLETYRPLVKGRIILVFGCPGDRDREKRPIMGEIAARLADHVIISTDDPHSEDPAVIIAEIEKGVNRAQSSEHRAQKIDKVEDRREAIERALGLASKDDIVLIAGRGHEKHQDLNGKKVSIDDRQAVRDFFKKRSAIFSV
jgi:UDP-N-acetylmuramoyl-L-alanyl-D-glutamate--2,6-diaminopimelate ligase